MSTNYALLSLGASATACENADGFEPSKAIDGDGGTRFSTHDTGTTGHWFAVDLGLPVSVSHFRLTQYAGAAYSATQVQLYKSDNGTDYTDLGAFDTPDYDDTFDIEPTTARYWKISRTTGGANTWTFYAWEIWGDPPGPLDPCEYPDVPTEGLLGAWLEHLDTYYVPDIEAYLAAN